jgi:hypothetical protein
MSETTLTGKTPKTHRHSFPSIAGTVFGAAVAWLAVAVIIGRIVVAVVEPIDPLNPPAWAPWPMLGLRFQFGIGLTFPSARGVIPIGISLHWWNLPGTILGAAVAFLIVRSVFRVKTGKSGSGKLF